ncbi:MAG TPA: tetratricopeptide repeat protein [Verrucomicrobiae bacterium]|jgi:tetratricopeptide (TPR) repeat protein|nr:tetratricopeptide repeat protein [Verrucomicrobiae bacterium]
MRMNARLTSILFLLLVILVASADDDAAKWKGLDHKGNKALKKNDYATAETLFVEASKFAEKFGPKDARYAETFRSLAAASNRLRHFGFAAMAYKRLADADGQRLGTNDIKVADDLLQYVEMAGYEKDFQNGNEALERATAIVLEQCGHYSYAMGVCYAQRGDLELQQSHLAIAETNFLKAIRPMEAHQYRTLVSSRGLPIISVLVPSRRAVASVFNQLGVCQYEEKKFGPAEIAFLRCIELNKLEYTDPSSVIAAPLANLARAYLGDGKLADAEKNARKAFSIVDRVEPSNPMEQSTRRLLATVLIAEGKTGEAKKIVK